MTNAFADQLALYGPDRRQSPPPTLAEARTYCRQLAETHYENFTVASWLLPKALRPHFQAIYAYCRWADDLADEVGDASRSLELLDWWERQLHGCTHGEATHPVFVALAETISQFEIPTAPFADLLTAFRLDQSVTRYETWDDLLGYCRNSANPVGRLVLYLGRCHRPETVALSDRICTGLQLANFWQDVAGDYRRGRIYLPQADCQRVEYSEDDFAAGRFTPGFRALLAERTVDAEALLILGRPLAGLVPRSLRLDISLFIEGGLAILRRIRAVGFDVWQQRPEISKREKLRLAMRCWVRSHRGDR